ncbi:unnamed protein product [Dovyalis caffra]|uniref:3-dehydrosphinganine reductase n=1 Tax=Dovyalis caffra TaxID=77055 RepID=A0AAV1RWN6_9ROSI|nr:unnamed protein product [Dovyalis caffra]
MANASLAYLTLLFLPPSLLLLLLALIVRPRPVNVPIKNRNVFITGGSSGIGLALAHQAASEGAKVSILARSLDKLEDAKQTIQLSTGVKVAVFAADVRDFDAVQRAVDQAGPIDVLIVNQGVLVPQELEKQGLDEVKFMLDVNLMGSFNMIKAALPAMKSSRKNRGPASITLMSSQAGQVGIYGYTAYSASKFGLRGLAEALQQEVIEDNIHVSLVFPPETETPALARENEKKPQVTSIIAASSAVMKADEVAKKALDGIKFARFIIPCNFEGFLLSIATAGLSPQRSFLMAFIEVIAAGAIRIAVLCFQSNCFLGPDRSRQSSLMRVKVYANCSIPVVFSELGMHCLLYEPQAFLLIWSILCKSNFSILVAADIYEPRCMFLVLDAREHCFGLSYMVKASDFTGLLKLPLSGFWAARCFHPQHFFF